MTHIIKPDLSIGSVVIRQYDSLYSLNDLHHASGGNRKYRPTFFLRNEQTQALIQEISRCADLHIKPVVTVRGRGTPQGTYACLELVIAYAAWISAAFHLKVIRVFLSTVIPQQPNLPLAAIQSHTADQAHSLAAQTATAISGLTHGRWITQVSNSGTATKLIDPRAVVLTPEQIAEELKTGELVAYFNQHELMQLMQAAQAQIQYRIERIASRQIQAANNAVLTEKQPIDAA